MLVTKLHSIRRARQIVALSLSVFLLAACNFGRPDPECVESGDLGLDLKKSIKIDSALHDGDVAAFPNGKWINTGMDVQQGKKLVIKSQGEIFLCMNNLQSVLVDTFTYTPNRNSSVWQDSGIVLRKDRSYKIEVSGTYNSWPGFGSCSNSKYQDADCQSRDGKQLFAYMGASPQTPWFGTENQDDADGVFEMYRRDGSAPTLMPSRAGFGINNVSADAKLWFRYRDWTFDDLNLANSFNGGYNDNAGGYVITVKEYALSYCKGEKGQFMEAQIRPLENQSPVNIDNFSNCYETQASPVGASGDICGNGIYSTSSAPATGRLYLKINDVVNSSGDGIYTNFVPGATSSNTINIPSATNSSDCLAAGGVFAEGVCKKTTYTVAAGTGSNDGEYNVVVTIPRPNTGGSMVNLVNSVVEPVRTLLRGTPGETIENSIQACTSKFGKVKVLTCSGLTPTQCSGFGGTTSGASNALICTGASSCGTGSVASVTCSVPPKGGITERIYKNVTLNSDFVQGVRALLVLAIVIFAFMYMAGLSSVTHKEFIYLLLKMGVIQVAISPTSWEIFYKYLFSFFLEGSDDLIWIMTSNINALMSDPSQTGSDLMVAATGTTGAAQGRAVFDFLSVTLTILFSQQTWIKIQAMITSFPLGIFYIGVVIVGILYFLIALVKAVLMYLTSIIMIAVLLFMGPIFVCFILFKRTNSIFQKWIGQMAVYALQPVILFIALAVFNLFILLALYSVLDYTVCYSCVWYFPSIIPGSNFCIMPGYIPWGTDSAQGVYTQVAKTPLALFAILIFIILTNAMVKFIDLVDTLTQQLVGDSGITMSTPGMASGVAFAQGKGIFQDTRANAFKVAKHTAGGMDYLSGNRISDGMKIAARNVITSPIPLPSIVTNAIIGRERDALIGGERRAYSTKFMTAAEKRGYEKKKADFASLTGDQQQLVRDAYTKDKMDLNESRGAKGVLGKSYEYLKDNFNPIPIVGGNRRENNAIRTERLSEFARIDQVSKDYDKYNKEAKAHNAKNGLKKGDEGYREEKKFNVYDVKSLEEGKIKGVSEIYNTKPAYEGGEALNIRSSSDIRSDYRSGNSSPGKVISTKPRE